MSELFAPLVPLVASYGGIGLFLFCALSASILPISSEAALVAVMSAGMDPWEALAWASAGNCGGVLLNYWIGHLGAEKAHEKLAASRFGRKALEGIEKYGVWGLLLSWTPFLGDPLTYAAGAFKIDLRTFIAITFPLRIARYLAFVLFWA